MLALTADNAMNNDKMVDFLELTIDNFPGQEHHVQCFLHITNLVANTLLRQFDAPTRNTGSLAGRAVISGNPETSDTELEKLTDGIEVEETEMIFADEGVEEQENVKDWEDARAYMTTTERANHDVTVQAVTKVLVKVSEGDHSQFKCSADGSSFPASQTLLCDYKLANSASPQVARVYGEVLSVEDKNATRRTYQMELDLRYA
jgi:hypothetical protein